MPLTKDLVTDALRRSGLPGREDLVASGVLQWVAACDDYASIKLHVEDELPTGALDEIASHAHRCVRRAAENASTPLSSLTVMFVDEAGAMIHSRRFTGDTSAAPAPGSQPASQPRESGGHKPIGGLRDTDASAPRAPDDPFASIKRVIAVGAGKGGVGKSTVAVNLAIGLARKGHAVGLMDGDIYGPSLPTMLGLASLEPQVHEGRIQPFLTHGVKAVTIGKLVDPEKPLIWRGPMAHGAFKQLAEQTSWGELDYLIVDLPPGTGDVPLTLAQTFRLTGAVIVCTPQRVAQDDAVRAARMFQQLNVEILGVVENMSYFIGDDGKEYDLFGRSGAERMAQRLGVPFLGAVPITTSLRQNSDEGDPTANFEEGSRLTESLERLVGNLEAQARLASMRQGASTPSISIS